MSYIVTYLLMGTWPQVTKGILIFNPDPAKLIYLNFHALEVVSRYRDLQPQVLENYSYLFNLRPNIYKC